MLTRKNDDGSTGVNTLSLPDDLHIRHCQILGFWKGYQAEKSPESLALLDTIDATRENIAKFNHLLFDYVGRTPKEWLTHAH